MLNIDYLNNVVKWAGQVSVPQSIGEEKQFPDRSIRPRLMSAGTHEANGTSNTMDSYRA